MNLSDTFWDVYEQIKRQKLAFFGVFFGTVLFTYFVLFVVDFIPEPVEKSSDSAVTIVDELVAGVSDTVVEAVAEVRERAPLAVIEPESKAEVLDAAALPTKIIFDSLGGREVVVKNPTSRAVADLDAALLGGVVRHPDSADFKNTGNILILGHSSYLPNVLNKNFQAFNGIQKLSWGDTVRVQSIDTEYIYRVDRVYEAKASEVTVPMSDDKAKLTLATCDSFGSTDDRFILEATLVKTVQL